LREFGEWLWEALSLRLVLVSTAQLALAALLGGIIGFERERSHRPAGFRTHIIVAVGSALVMLTGVAMSKGGEFGSIDPTRMAAQVVSGIGFLGAGTILREGFSVKGLTTAASLWTVSCIGLACGGGYYAGAVLGTVIIILTLNLLKKILMRGSRGKSIYIEIADVAGLAPEIGQTIKRLGGSLHSLEILYADDEKRRAKEGTIVLKALVFAHSGEEIDIILEALRDLDGILDMYVD